MKKILIALGAFAMITALTACNQEDTGEGQSSNEQTKEIENSSTSIASNNFYEAFDGDIDHIHGMGYAGSQGAVYFAAHDGLKILDNGNWYKTKEENNDYMGFNATENGFYSSGHPGSDSTLPNPVGIIQTTNGGQTLESLTLEGESDFHAMGVGFKNETIVLLNGQKNSLMEENSFYLSEDMAKTWKKVSAKGLEDQILSIAVHPTNANLVAAVGMQGVYLSEDKAESFTLISEGLQGTSVYFTEDALFYGGYNGSAVLVKRTLQGGTEEDLPLPELKEDAIMYIAQNPQKESEIFIVTFNGNIYQSTDGSNKWNLLVEDGKIQ